ncbi:phosphate transport system regulatory protein PhoU [Betaproteobacteria bacterium]|nr:phosphate transport system regulatory protein PhoU [Betaproteobacteria bacterium]GHT92421.1 phosphate transport system regulatory protein PhoU [Betaproteobacteria bacterium]GHU01609.1 phosphate transport system regulatory protein PhoU [Betaproteobacteria bacterium]GHU09957.1 phosphate transport system regulatory protein PhoU [Betaproteobacteria bacterium]GHU24128.1 phosphate transport system regulatory protein PhoU [Betaproteobacteria bacterium]
MNDKHLSSQFDSDLNTVSSRLMEMGGLVEKQIQGAVTALSNFSVALINDVLDTEEKVDALEVEIDRALTTVVARRQPAARDLRLLLAISKITTNLERVGDEAYKISKRIKSIVESGDARKVPIGDLRVTFDLAASLIHRALDAFARLDVSSAVTIFKEDDLIDSEFKGFTRKLITYMMEDPHTISSSLDLLFIAKAVERIGDHAKNIAEFVIYIVQGTDVRHSRSRKTNSSSNEDEIT